MKTKFLPALLRPALLAAVCASLTASLIAQAPAPGAPAAPGTTAPVAPGTTAPAATPAPKPFGPGEKNFIKNASRSLYYQVKVAEAAKTVFTDPKEGHGRLRDTAIKDLNKAWSALEKVAKPRGETVVAELIGSDKTGLERMTKLKDEKFAKEWTEELAKESKKLDKDFESATRTTQDADLKTYLQNYGPMVHSYFVEAEKAEKAEKNPKKK